MIVQTIVEGQGDVAAVPVLLRRLAEAAGAHAVTVARPHRRRRTELVRQGGLQTSVRVARLTPGCAGILVLLDADDDCPKVLAPTLQTWAAAAASPIPCAVVMANREYEAWLLAGVEGMRGKSGIDRGAKAPVDPESPRDAKGELQARMADGSIYSPTADQAPLTARLDLHAAWRSCRSFRKLVGSFGALLRANNELMEPWPPAAWTA